METVTSDVVSVVPETEVQPQRLSEVDRLVLELAKSKRQVALAEAKTALALNDAAEVSYKYTILQIYMKYNLTMEDAVNENGEIIIGGASAK